MEENKNKNYNKLIDLMLLGTVVIFLLIAKTVAEASEITLAFISSGF